MKIIFNTLKEATEFMKIINQGTKYNAYFKNVKGEVHVILEEREITPFPMN